MRRIMARLVTVEQAARIAAIPVEQLLHDLNEALGIESEASSGSPVDEHRSEAPSPPTRPLSAPVVELDVRDDLRSGREPFGQIMRSVSSLGDDGVLHVRAIFEPVPLFSVLGKRGFAHESKAHAADDWSVWFWRPRGGECECVAEEPAPACGDCPPDDERTTYLDVRGCSPPEPMLRTLAALDTLAPGHVLVQINARVPQFLLPVLVERGFAYEIDDSRDEHVLVRICHAR